MASVPVYEILDRKRRGERLTDFEIEAFITGFTWGGIPDYQMAALLMAIAIRGLNQDELAALMRTMLESGEQWNLRERFDFVGDKHSSGGVGDKISLVLAPWVASCGIHIAMLSGRGLGHTGGTLDKVETIPGFNARLSRDQVERCLARTGCVISTSTEGIAPADRKLYALRDVTGTVESIPLITASIMSKKLALGPSALVLDVKCGRGAFMKEPERAFELARSLIAAARGSGTRVEALVTRMDEPLGEAVGNASEVAEAFRVLRGQGPPDVTELTRAQAIRLLVMSGRFDDDSAAAALDAAIRSGTALQKAREWIAAQGGDPGVVDDDNLLPQPAREIAVSAPVAGFVRSIDAYAAGMLGIALGAGRETKEQAIDPAAGLRFDVKVGAEVRAGEILGRLQLGTREVDLDEMRKRFSALFEIGDAPPASQPLILGRLGDRQEVPQT